MKRDCQCKQANHQHGTRTAYVVDKCRCDDCRAASTAVENRRRRLKAFGRYESPYVDAEPVREHVLWLRENGISIKRLSELTGVPSSNLGRLLYGRPERQAPPAKRLLKANAERIMGIRPARALQPAGARVPATGTQRRTQALVAIGYSVSRQANMLGRHPEAHIRLLYQDAVEVATADAVRALYERLWDKPFVGVDQYGKAAEARARNMARSRGWAPPMAWDDETIDDPAAQPQGLPEAGRVPAADRVADVEDLLAAGVTGDALVTRAGFNSFKSFEKFMYRHGRGDLATRCKGLVAA